MKNILRIVFLVVFSSNAQQKDSLVVPISENNLDEIVISGTLKPVSRLETPVPVEVYSSAFLKKNPTSNIFEALQNVNGVRPQLNCNICNTGDIHINGLEGPYTMVTIDGMPIVSALSTVYGLSGIPNSLIDRIEIIKGPASSLYGSEAIGGLINIITKKTKNAPLFTADFFSTSWLENNIDLGFKANIGKTTESLVGINYYNYNYAIDNNHDNFTDVTLQDRISIFNKWNFIRKSQKEFTVAGRFFFEDRWGGEMQWNKNYRGGNQIYGESIYTTRFELLSKYQLPTKENMSLSFSLTSHDQNSVYGTTLYLAQQKIAFGQYLWDKKLNRHNLLFGAAFRHQYYNDNTTATLKPESTNIYSIFIQDEIKLAEKNSILLVDYIILARTKYKLSNFDSIIDACSKRARPIIMTTIAMIAGMLPMALSNTDAFKAPMAITVIGGLLTSTILSLLIIPCVFLLTDKIKDKINK